MKSHEGINAIIGTRDTTISRLLTSNIVRYVMASKHCTKCKTLKPLLEFGLDKTAKDGHRSNCKSCENASATLYRRTINGLINKSYCAQVSRSRKRGHAGPAYTVGELYNWATSQSAFYELYHKWVESGYDVNLTPSFDRTDDYQGYSLERLKIMAWKDNKKKGCDDRLHGRNNKGSTAVIQLSIKNEFIAEYHSQQQASRETGISQAGISGCCTGRYNDMCGFKWMFA